MSSKNRISKILQTAGAQIKVSFLVTFCLDWDLKLIGHRRALTNDAFQQYRHQAADDTSQLQKWSLKYPSEFSGIMIVYLENLSNQLKFSLDSEIHEIQNFKIPKLKLWVTEMTLKSVLLCYIMILQLITIKLIEFKRFRILMYFHKSYGLPNLAVMFKLTEEHLKERLYMDYRDLINIMITERVTLTEILTQRMIQDRLHWWPIRAYENNKEIGDMLTKQIKNNFLIERKADIRLHIVMEPIETIIIFCQDWFTDINLTVKAFKYTHLTAPLRKIESDDGLGNYD
jgi:hypothetical protein